MSVETYYVQGKNGTHDEWKTISTTKDVEKAHQSCAQKMKQKRRSVGFEWYKTRVAILVDGKFQKVVQK